MRAHTQIHNLTPDDVHVQSFGPDDDTKYSIRLGDQYAPDAIIFGRRGDLLAALSKAIKALGYEALGYEPVEVGNLAQASDTTIPTATASMMVEPIDFGVPVGPQVKVGDRVWVGRDGKAHTVEVTETDGWGWKGRLVEDSQDDYEADQLRRIMARETDHPGREETD